MEKETRSTIAWILSRPEGKQFLTASLFVIALLGFTIIRQEYRFENNVNKMQQMQRDHTGELNDCKQETIELLKVANADAQKMRDSLYTMGMRQKEIEHKINKR